MGLRLLVREVGRLIVSAAVSAMLLVAACSALFVTSAPKWVSLAVEPLSLLLVPGVGLSMIFTKEHDYTQWEIVRGALVFYTVVLYAVLWWWGRQRSLARRQVDTIN